VALKPPLQDLAPAPNYYWELWSAARKLEGSVAVDAPEPEPEMPQPYMIGERLAEMRLAG